MNIGIISIYSFPEGLAPTNRIKAYAKGLIQNGAKVKLYLPFPTYSYHNRMSMSKEGIIETIPYCYTSKIHKSKYKIGRAIAHFFGIRKIYGYVSAGRKIYKDNKKIKIDCLIVSTDHLLNLWVFSLVAQCIQAKAIFIFDEYPIPIRHKLKNSIPKWKTYLYGKILKKYSAYVSISEKLKDYYCGIIPIKTLILSSITDIDRFSNIKVIDKSDDNYICYMGNMELSKDNVDLIIRAYAQLQQTEFLTIKLFLYGMPSSSDKAKLTQIIDENKLENKVFFKGKASYEEVPTVLCNATLLVSSQPDTLRASGGFPTKLGEYLMSSVPVLLSDVGENSKFVSDNKQVFFAKPNSIEDFAFKMQSIFSNYEFAKSVALEGKRYVINNYSHVMKGKELLNFISEIVANNKQQ